MQPQTNMALRAARAAGQIIVRAMDRLDELTVEEKAHNDFVSSVDRDAEAAIVSVLADAYPEYGVRGEEGALLNADAEFCWVIDPLDGTLNYLQGIPHFCISIALMKGEQFEHGVIVDPLRNEEFIASRGMGAKLNGKRIRVSSRRKLNDAVLATGIPPSAIEPRLEPYIASLGTFTGKCRGIRRMGSAALDLAYVAAGRMDGFFEPGLKPWDIAAGTLIVREAGGFVGDFSGGDDFMRSGDIVAGNPHLFKLMAQVMRANFASVG